MYDIANYPSTAAPTHRSTEDVSISTSDVLMEMTPPLINSSVRKL